MLIARRVALGAATVAAALVGALVAGCTTGTSRPDPPGTRAGAGPSGPRKATGTPTAPRSTTPTTPAAPTHTTPSVPSTPATATTPTAPSVAPLSAAQRRAGLVDIRSAVPDAVIALAYARTDNWTGHRFYPKDARCLVHRTMLPGLTRAAATLRKQGYRLAFWDCYRPRQVQKAMFDMVQNADWVARPGPQGTQHEVGRAVDITLAHRSGSLVDMGSGYCDFTPISWSNATKGLTHKQIANRATLRRALESDGSLWNYTGEWWHFNGPGSHTPRPHLDVPVD